MKKSFALIWFLWAVSSYGQEAPKNLKLTPAAEAQFSITYEKQNGPTGSPANGSTPAKPTAGAPKPVKGAVASNDLIKADYVITNPIGSVKQTYQDGTSREAYVINGVALVQDPKAKQVRAETISQISGDAFHFVKQYPGFEWVTPSKYVDTVSEGQTRLYHFHQNATPNNASGIETFAAKQAAMDCEAWLNADTGLPFSFRLGDTKGVYQFGSAPVETLVLPAAFERAWKFYNGYP